MGFNRRDRGLTFGVGVVAAALCFAVYAGVGSAAFPGKNGVIAVVTAGPSVALDSKGRFHTFPIKVDVDRLVWSRDGKRLLVSVDNLIYVADEHGRRIKGAPSIKVGILPRATWSRLAGSVIYSRYTRHCQRALVVYRFSDRSTTQISPCDGANRPAASPTADTVAYTASSGAVRLIDLRTGDLKTIFTTLDGSPATGTGDSGTAWSPDGRELAFSTGRTLAAYNVATGEIRTIVPAYPDENVGIGSASWSPDGRQIAFVRFNPPTVEDNDTHLYLVNADGTNLRESLGPAIDSPDWQPLS